MVLASTPGVSIPHFGLKTGTYLGKFPTLSQVASGGDVRVPHFGLKTGDSTV